MKRLCVAVFLMSLLFITLGCSSAPPGAVSVRDLNEKEAELLGKHVIVVGTAETKTEMSAFNMFKVYKGGDNIWVAFPELGDMPPQGETVLVEGTLKRKKFTGIPEEQLYIEATIVTLN